MMGIDPNTRRPAYTVPTRRTHGLRPSQSSRTGDRPHESHSHALIPVGPVRDGSTLSHQTASSDVYDSSGRLNPSAGIELQSKISAPRRGLRADANERSRYMRAYADAAAPTRPYQAAKYQVSA